MKKDPVILAMLPYTSDEEAALTAKLQALSGAELTQYIQSAENSLNNSGLAPAGAPALSSDSVSQRRLYLRPKLTLGGEVGRDVPAFLAGRRLSLERATAM